VSLTLSKRGDYAVRAAVYLASAWDTTPLVMAGDISRAMHIPPSYAPQVMGYLLRAGVITVKNGRGGGYRLARRPSDVSLLEVVEAAEGDLTPRRCPLRGVPASSDRTALCTPGFRPVWTCSSGALRGPGWPM
jgi:Rrf2 family protein